MVAASVGGVGDWVGVGVFSHNERVKLSQHGHGWSGGTSGGIGAHSSDCQSVSWLHSHSGELLSHQLGGLEFPESRLRILKNRLGDGHEIIGFGVDNLGCFTFQVLFRGHYAFSK